MTTTTKLSPTETIQAVYEAFGRGDLETILGFVHEEADWCHTAGGAIHPVLVAGRGMGHDAVRAYFAAVAKHFAITRFVPLHIAANAEGYVFSLIDLEFSDPAVGKTVELHEVHVFKVVDGKVVYYEPVVDTAKTAAAFGAR